MDGQPPVSSATIGYSTDTPVPSPTKTTAEEMDISPEEYRKVLRDKTPEYLIHVMMVHNFGGVLLEKKSKKATPDPRISVTSQKP